jgi:hypothetical protein
MLRLKVRDWLKEMIVYWKLFQVRSPISKKELPEKKYTSIEDDLESSSVVRAGLRGETIASFRTRTRTTDRQLLEQIIANQEKLEKQMSQITDAVSANTNAVGELTAASSSLATAVTSTGTLVQGLQTQVANDDTAGNAAAATTLATNNQAITDAASAISAAAAALAALATPTSTPAS